MHISALDFSYPEELIATEPVSPSRILWHEEGNDFEELTTGQALDRVAAGDVLVVNNTKVLKRRVFTESGLEILFLKRLEGKKWQVLMPARKLKLKETIQLPEGETAWLVEKGRPQILETEKELSEEFFEKQADLPLPPYIQKMREQRRNVEEDESWYQTEWAAQAGSLAAPTASFHWTKEQLDTLQKKGVKVLYVTLHVGLGTFLPVTSEDLDEHQMHSEEAHIDRATWLEIQEAKSKGHKVWALGTTVARTLESAALGLLATKANGDLRGETELFIQPGFEWQVVDRLMTNFHQPRSTLLALVAAFVGLERVKEAYAWAIERKFRLFSYGDTSIWVK